MSSESKLMLGFRVHPTDEELINYLKNFVLRGVLPPTDVIKVVDLFGDSEPWQIIIDASEEKTRYFLSPLKRFKNSTKKFQKTVGKGTWKGQTSGKPITKDGSKYIIGFKRSLKYHSDIEKDHNDNGS
ncbi:putative NAC domain-containing protein 94 [Lycium barbarum]|uniref:putative NAC domain-containing protein 94 n=1 Tax=Lycium barbarum TaxID=112863 RepID=UPI00293E7FF3|nr:putative NAC domain-containing protein 94 [Lycium barbarum]